MMIPWIQVVRLLPSLVQLSKDILDDARRSRAVKGLDDRVLELEQSREAHARLVDKLVRQVEALTQAATILRRVMLACIIVSIVALATAISAIILFVR